jgi:hypothetical protein
LRQVGHATVTRLPRKERVEGGAGLSLPGSNFTEEVPDGLARGIVAHGAHLDRQLLVDPNAHWVRRVALEGLNRLVEG